MIISHKHKYIFIKPTKVAGTSLEVALAESCGKEDIITPITEYSESSDDDRYEHLARNFDGYYNHLPPSEIKKKIRNDTWNNYYKFTVIRNPWDQVVSRYHWEKYRTEPDLVFNYFIENFEQKWTNTRFYFNAQGKLICDYYIRYENLYRDYKQVCDHLGIPNAKLPRLKSKHRKNRRHYSKYYNKKTRKIVRELFIKEIECFNYQFQET
ncbi:hypothetical protein A2715_01975 [Candidatus Woesebacteria bacterium RIFCSPHIGHO2_01_FULL_39_32]|uniref:Sulfotransferase domain-containing protein n=1 Tax=Candidatus Woesebacteria bacterium RIFCSPLOWO2_01_FULL_39_25 TaxID=1802521 RepID=A0A1F8BJ69_9BACT|nr:MAG: hypothetical protein A2124_04590 [Candidatus Woesebacteria bacterium GWB1_37_5]OGM23925.1 MAG: hypothetical protein A2715_01975 [Candidatus Woesebacteria bacterium RIFCSPHIGHO2_01_FULL_39_32]OGM37431.1 MAG: hypothetical protein A3F01_03210 [Candidatus Woesebacteria bacterium RIFCSPHIGHO2_12_FULL_38_11]OGM64114.1 MAG: hypothetical protein A2893_03215 [Candidatus Woesebacteria bacterium RIFCSPLOWO2_01_FULL_39_25]